jgi:hypothetical protein
MKNKMIIITILWSILSCQFFEKSYPPFIYQGEKAKGLSFVAPNKPIDSTHIQPITNIGANFVSLMPYGFVKENSAQFNFIAENDTTKRQHIWWGETPDGIRESIRLAHAKNIKIMLKPHIWIAKGTFTGHFGFRKEADWNIFESGYQKYILQYAQIAESQQVEIFCLATEMERSIKERPKFWNNLIKEIRKVYKGKLTYAENWDAFKKVPFWSELDFIGIDGYFPLSDDQKPSIKAFEKGWKPYKNQLKNFAGKYQKPILFTEFGYRSCDYTAQKPWDTDFSFPDNEKAQADGYSAFFNTIWPEEWFAGVFIWKWFPISQKNMRHKDTFSPQNKVAELVLKQAFKDYKLAN